MKKITVTIEGPLVDLMDALMLSVSKNPNLPDDMRIDDKRYAMIVQSGIAKCAQNVLRGETDDEIEVLEAVAKSIDNYRNQFDVADTETWGVTQQVEEVD